MHHHNPPGPRDWTLGMVQLAKVKADLLGYYLDLVRRYGDTVLVRYGPYRSYHFFHPDQIREVLITKNRHFEKADHIRKAMAQLDGNGLIISEGDFWLRQRRLVQPAFHPRRMEHYGRLMVEQTARLVNDWRKGDKLERDVVADMTGLTLEIAAKAFFGAEVTGHTAQLGQAVAVMSEVMVREFQEVLPLPDWLPLSHKRQKRWAFRYLDETVREFIRQRRAASTDQGDLLSMLLLAVDEEAGGGRMTDEQARDEVMTLFMAGHDTTAAALAWVWHVLAAYPVVQARVIQEVDAVLNGHDPEAADVPRLDYLNRVIQETLRLYPPAIGVFTRTAATDVEIGGYVLAKGSLVQILSYVTHRDPRWFPDPERFDPDRFLPERVQALPQFAYFPFGGGPRVCIGQGFAMTEIVLVVATMLRQLRVFPAPNQGPVALQPHMSLRPRGGLRLRWEWR
jgi:cytochrome P450